MKKRYIEVSKRWCEEAPFLATFTLHFDYIEDKTLCQKDENGNDIPTVGISYQHGKFKIHYHPDAHTRFKVEEDEGVLLHEVMHLLTFTQKRLNYMSNRSHKILNIAADMCINDEILSTFTINSRSIKLPDWVCKPEQLRADFKDKDGNVKKGYDGDLIVEPIYFWMMKERVEYVTLDQHTDLDKIDWSDIEVRGTLETLKRQAASKSWGRIGSDTVTKLKKLLEPERVPFQKVFRKRIPQLQEKGSIKKYSWKKVNRRSMPLQGKYKTKAKFNIGFDTSGSCYSENIQGQFFGEIDYMSTRYDLTIYQIDTTVTAKDKYRKGMWKNINIKGCGGTVMQPLFDRLKADKQLNVPLIMFTDGFFDTDINTYGIQVYWLLTEESNNSFFKNKYVFEKNL